MQFYGPYNEKMAITSFILTAECERLVPSYSVTPWYLETRNFLVFMLGVVQNCHHFHECTVTHSTLGVKGQWLPCAFQVCFFVALRFWEGVSKWTFSKYSFGRGVTKKSTLNEDKNTVFCPGLKKGMVLLEEKGHFCSRNYILRALSHA